MLTPPRPIRNEGAQYPKQALADGVREKVTVIVVLQIDTAGGVTSAVVETPIGHGFDEAAKEAAMKLLFEPAKRDGVPIASKIKFTYDFAPPASALSGRVVTVGDRPIEGARVEARSATGEIFRSVTNVDGRWNVPQLPFGRYDVRVQKEGFSVQEASEDLAPGEEAVITSRMSIDAPPPVAPTPESPTQELEEVQVRGARPPREVTRRTVEQREINRIPGTSGDALRSLQNLPGVARPPGLAGLLIVRGSSPQDTEVFVDGTQIPLVYHFGGLSSVVPTEMLDRIDFYPGNFSAQYGRVMGGIVDVGMRDPKKDRVHGFAQVDLIDARVIAETPLWDSGWKVAVSGRRSYIDLWLRPALESSGTGVTAAPVYYDYQAMVQRDLPRGGSVRFLFLGSDDRFEIVSNRVPPNQPSAAGDLSLHTGFWRFQGRYKQKFGESSELRLTSAVGQDFADFALGDLMFKITSLPISARTEWAQRISPKLTTNIGLDLFYAPYEIAVRAPAPGRPGEPSGGPFLSRPKLEFRDDDSIYRPAFFTEFEATPWKGGRIVPGLRLDYAKDTKSWDLSPRITVRQDVTQAPRTTLKGGIGIYHQPPQPQQTNIVFGMPGLHSNRAIHYGLGVEREVTRNVDLSFEGFYKQLDSLVTQRAGNVGTGQIYGLETLIRYKPDAHFFGWLAYTLSRSERRDTPADPTRLSPFDQTHILTVLGSYRLGRGWEIGARFRLVSGNRYTPNTYGFYDENSGVNLPLSGYPPYSERLPLFHQLDIRVDKTWRLSETARLGVYLDVQNVYNHGNVEAVSYNYNFTRNAYTTGLPIIPNLGLRGEF